MRTKETIKKDFVRIAIGEYCYNANKLKLEVLLDIRDSLRRKHRKLTEQQKKKLRKGLERYWKKQMRRRL